MNNNKANQLFCLKSCSVFDLGKILLILFFLFSFSSCEDDGCIEADDFGEYEQEIVTVKANYSDETCTYDPTKDLIDAEQGSGLKDCLVKGSVSISDQDNNTFTSSTGCLGFDESNGGKPISNICVEQCRQKCMTSTASSPSGAEPMWQPTSEKQEGKNIGVTLTPGAEIYVRATGTVSLSGDKNADPIFVGSKKSGLQSFADDLSKNVIQDVKFGTTKAIKFSGIWRDGVDDFPAEDVGGSISGGTSDPNFEGNLYNGARRLVIYVVNRDGYGFDSSQTNEKEGVIGIPLNADTDLWTCYYSDNSQADFKQSDCRSLAYDDSRAGYGKNINSALAVETYGISSANQSKNLGKSGGAIRWKDDGLKSITDSNDDPFKGCTSDCVSLDVNASVGYIDATTQFTNNNPYPVELRARISSGASSCTITYTIKDSNGTLIKNTVNDPVGTDDRSWIIANGWSNPIVLETGDKLTAVPKDCGKYTIVRIDKVQEITIATSGLAKFTTLGGVMSTCSIIGRVINPDGSRNPFAVSGASETYAADFYEYNSNSDDPLNNLSVPNSPSPQSTTTSSYLSPKTWSKPVFVRKGQRIRFSSSSWNEGFTTYNGSLRQCGIGMVMKIDERPAFLCRGKNLDKIANSKCLPEVNSADGTATKCKKFAPECYDATDSVNYCPVDSCQTTWESSCAVAKNGTNAAVTQNTCDTCKALKERNGAETVTKEINLPMCYDLEDYKGSVVNIDIKTGFSDDQLKKPEIAKGAVKLGKFNGTYGNFENFIDTKTKEDATYQKNNIYQLRDPVTFSKSGRVKFLILDGNKFKDIEDGDSSQAYSGNGVDGTKGKNGYKINLSGKQEFVNGEMLEAILCLEDDSGVACSPDLTSGIPLQIASEPEVVRLKFDGISAQNKTYYKFDDYGSLVRINNSGVLTPEPFGDNHVGIGSNFYRHSYPKSLSDEDMKKLSDADKKTRNDKIAKVRLTFKIKDADIPTCSIASPSDCSGGDSCNGIKMDNKFYDGKTGTGLYCGANESPGEDGCKKQYFCGNLYSNNSGSYQVTVRVKNKGSNISNMVNGVVSPVVEIMDGKKPNCNTSDPTSTTKSFDGVKIINASYDSSNNQNNDAVCSLSEYKTKDSSANCSGSILDSCLSACKKQYACTDQNYGQAQRVYKMLINDSRYKAILNVSLILMITFYGVGYLMGVSEFSQSEIIGRVIKIGVIYLFVGNSGWYWFEKFFVQFFKNGTDYLAFVMATSFDRSPELKQAVDNYNFYDKSVLFSSVDKVFGMFFSSAVQKKVSALLFASIFGWAYLIIIYWGFMAYVYAVANAILLYLTSQIFISILFVLGPIFLISLLFNQTKEMFDKWLSQLISFSLQQIFLLTTLSFFNMMMYEVIKLSLGFRVCWDDVWVINIITRIKLLSFWTVASMPPRLNSQTGVGNTGNATSIPSIFSIMFIWIVASLMQKFISFMTDVAASISDGISASSLSDGIKSMGNKMIQMGDKAMSGAWKKLGGEAMVQRLDKKLFDSGKLADKEREERKAQNKKNAEIKRSMAKSGDKAVKEFKEKNLDELAKLSPSQQKEKLKEIYDKASIEAGKKSGLTEDQAKALASDKGFKYEGNNVLGAAYQAAKQMALSGGTLNKSIGERKIHRTITKDNVRAAMKNLDKDGREVAKEAFKSGKLKAGRTGFMGSTIKDMGLDRAGKNIKAGLAKIGIRSGADKEAYKQARDQLADEGAIDRLNSIGLEIARPSEEKEMIKKRIQANKEAAKIGVSENSAERIAYVEQFAEQADKDEDVDKRTKSEWKQLGNQIGREVRSFTNSFNLNRNINKGKKEKKEALEQNWDDVEKMQQGELENEMNEAKTNKEQSIEKKNEWIDRAGEINASKEMTTMKGLQENHKKAIGAKTESLAKKNEWANKSEAAKAAPKIQEMNKLQEKLKKASPVDKASLEAERDLLSRDVDYKEQLEILEDADNNLNQHTHEFDDNTAKENEAKDNLDNYHDDSAYIKQLEKLGEANTNANYYKHQADVYGAKEEKIKPLIKKPPKDEEPKT